MPSDKVQEMIDQFLEQHGEHFRWGPGHITMDDGNVEDSNLHFCINEINERLREWCPYEHEAGEDDGHTVADLVKLRGFMNELLEIPEDERDIEEEEYDDSEADYPSNQSDWIPLDEALNWNFIWIPRK